MERGSVEHGGGRIIKKKKVNLKDGEDGTAKKIVDELKKIEEQLEGRQ